MSTLSRSPAHRHHTTITIHGDALPVADPLSGHARTQYRGDLILARNDRTVTEWAADVGLGWPLLRRMLHELGRRLVAAGALADPPDVFWLKLDEAEAAARALDANQAVTDSREVVAQRRATWERERKVTPPVVLPI